MKAVAKAAAAALLMLTCAAAPMDPAGLDRKPDRTGHRSWVIGARYGARAEDCVASQLHCHRGV